MVKHLPSKHEALSYYKQKRHCEMRDLRGSTFLSHKVKEWTLRTRASKAGEFIEIEKCKVVELSPQSWGEGPKGGCPRNDVI
jgi:hypothetical protein